MKPSNILIEKLSESLRILKIGDISISNIDIHLLKKTVVGKMDRETSPAYIAPEVIKNEAATNKVDMWGLGIILYLLVASGKHPFPDDHSFEMKKAILDNEPALALLPLTVSPFIKKTIKALLAKNPDSRPDAQTLVNQVEFQA